jgi:hypothetical protein
VDWNVLVIIADATNLYNFKSRFQGAEKKWPKKISSEINFCDPPKDQVAFCKVNAKKIYFFFSRCKNKLRGNLSLASFPPWPLIQDENFLNLLLLLLSEN